MVEIAVEGRERLPQSVAALWPRGVLDEVLGDQVERGVVTTLEGLVEGLHDLRGRHRAIPHDGSSCARADASHRTVGGQQPPTSRHACHRPCNRGPPVTAGAGQAITSPSCEPCRSPASAVPRSSTSSTSPSRRRETASSSTTSRPPASTSPTPTTRDLPTELSGPAAHPDRSPRGM